MLIKRLIQGTAALPLAIIGGLLIIYFLFLPPVLKYLIEKEGAKQLGRKVEVGYTTFNIFKGSFNMHNFRVYEPDGKHLFLSFRRFYINLNIREVLNKVYHIESVGLDEPVVHITQVDSTFNFSDILERFSSDTTGQAEEEPADTSEASGPVKYIVEDFSITFGTISYANPDFQLNDTIRGLELSSPLAAWDNPELAVTFLFNLASGGDFKGNIKINTSDQSMVLQDTIDNFNISNYKHYLEPYMLIGSLEGYLHTENMLTGNTSTFDLNMSGNLALTDFSMTDTAGGAVASFRKFSVTFEKISFSEDILSFDTISLVEPVINYILTAQGDNFTAMMPASAPTDSLATGQATESGYTGENPVEMMVGYVQESMDTYLFQSYRINHLQLLNGRIIYEDRTLDEPFRATIDSLNLDLSNLTTEVDRSSGTMSARINDEGHFKADISVNPRDLLDMNLKYEISSLMVPDFNPYSVYYIAYPFPRGAFNYQGSLIILDRKLSSENKIVIEKIYIGDKVKNSTAVGLPIKLALAILRDRNGDIRLDVPVTGDLNDPKVKIGRIILDILKNIVIKAATAPYDLLAAAFGGNENDYKEIRFEYLQKELREKQQKQLEAIAAILTEKPEMNVSFTQILDPVKEKVQIAIFETKKLYHFEYLKKQQVPVALSGQDSLDIAAINAQKDLSDFFASRLDETLMALTLEEKCYYMAGVDKVNRLQEEVVAGRNQSLARYLNDNLVIPADRFTVTSPGGPAPAIVDYPYFSIKFDVKE
jgi:hypothetical protein